MQKLLMDKGLIQTLTFLVEECNPFFDRTFFLHLLLDYRNENMHP